MSELTDLIEGVINGSADQKRATGTPGNDGLPKEGSTPASKAPKAQGKVGAPPVVTTDVEVKNKDAAKVSKLTKKAKEPAPKVAGGDTSQPPQGSSKEATPDNKKLGEDEEHYYEDEEVLEEGEDAFELPETKAGMAKLVFDMLRSMDKDELSEKYVDILNAILVENEEAEEEIDEESASIAREARARITADDIDISDDVQALLSNEDQELSEDFQIKAAIIFEAAVVSKINSEIDKLEEDFASEISESRATFEANLTDKVDGYLNYVVEEWMKENELAVERGIKTELTDDFITGLKNLFTEHYIEIPDEKVDVVDDLAERIEELETKLNESIETNIDLVGRISVHEKEEIFHQLSNGLADTEREKLESLSEGVQYEDAEQYIRAIATLKESYFPQAPKNAEEEDTDELLSESLSTKSSSVDRYADAIGRTVRR
jgi:hypothetical protein